MEKSKNIKKRGSRYHFKQRIPAPFTALFTTSHIELTLGTDSLDIAQERASAVNALLKDYFAELGNNEELDPIEQFSKRVKTLKRSGFQYIPHKNIIQETPLFDTINRINAAAVAETQEEKRLVLGVDEKPPIEISRLPEEFFLHERIKLSKMNANEQRKYKNKIFSAAKNMNNIIGNKPIKDLCRNDILDFREWWLNRIIEDGISTNTANRQISNIKKGIRICNDKYELGLHVEEMFSQIPFKDEQKKERMPFPSDYIQNVILGHHYKNEIEEVKLLIFAMADTGCRIKELTGIKDSEVFLDADIPYIVIQPNDVRTLKTTTSKRTLPLVGSALYAFQRLGGGFKHYLGKSETASAAANKYLREQGLYPSPEHTLYSLRHSFEDRLTAVEPPEKIQAQLMGHKFFREKYGQGASLEQKKKWLDKIAFKIR